MDTPTLPGWYEYLDAIGGPAQRIQVLRKDGELVARFHPIEGDEEGAELPVADISGTFEGPFPAKA